MLVSIIVIVIVISKLIKRYSKAKRTRAPAYSRALRRIKGGFSKGGIKRSSGPISRILEGDRVETESNKIYLQYQQIYMQRRRPTTYSMFRVMSFDSKSLVY